MKMRINAILLSLMIGYDLSLHIVELFDKVRFHFLYPIFPLFGAISYDVFWTIYWVVAFIITLILIKNKSGGKK